MYDALEETNGFAFIARNLFAKKPKFGEAAASNEDVDIDKLAMASGFPTTKVQEWLDGAEISAADRNELALSLNTPVWVFSENFCEIYNFATFQKIASNHIYVPEESPFDGYWGNIGLKAPGQKNSIWMSCSDMQAAFFRFAILKSPNEPFYLAGMGCYSYIVNPKHMKIMRALPEACDPPEGDWEISKLDPMGGLSVGLTSLFSQGFNFIYDEGLDVPEGYFDILKDIAPEEEFYDAMTSMKVFYRDGSVEVFKLDYYNPALEQFTQDLFDENFEGVSNTSVLCAEYDEAEFFIPLKNVALIQLPSHYSCPSRT